MRSFTRGKGFAIRPQGNVAREFFEHAALEIFEAGEERGSDQARSHANQDAVEQVTTDDTQLQALGLLQEPAGDPQLPNMRCSFEEGNDAGANGHCSKELQFLGRMLAASKRMRPTNWRIRP